MMPQHFNPTLGGQQGMPQQQHPPQAQVDHHQQSVQGVLNDNRAWQMAQLQQFRQQQGVGDMGGGPSNSNHVLDLIRNQQFARQQQQMQQAHQQQQFGFGGPMNANAGAPAMQDQQGHNFQQFQKQQFTPMQLQSIARNPAMLQALQNQTGMQTGMSRQLDLMVAHQQQSNQTNNASAVAFRQLQQQQQQQQAQQAQQQQLQAGMGNQMLGNLAQGGFFNNPSLSQQPPDNLSGLLPNGLANQRQAGMPPLAMAQRPPGQVQQVPQNALHMMQQRQLENKAKLVELRRKEQILANAPPNPQVRAEMSSVQHEISQIVIMDTKLTTMLQQQQHQSRIQSSMNGMNMQPQGAQPGNMLPNNQAVPNWLPTNGPSPANNFGNAQLQSAMSMSSNTPLQQHAQPNHTPGVLPPRSLAIQPPRSGPTPISHNMSQNGMQSSPNMPRPMASPPNVSQPSQPPIQNAMPQLSQQQQPFLTGQRAGPNQMSPGNQIPALPAEAFKAAYSQWCTKQGLVHDDQLLQIEGKKIDLHRLHQEVIAAGTMHRLGNNLDLWAIVGGRLDFVQFPGKGPDEPPRSGPGVAQKLQHVYREYLSQFDSTFLRSVLSKRYGPHAVQSNAQPPQGPQGLSGAGAGGPSAPSVAPNAAVHNAQMNNTNANPLQQSPQGLLSMQALGQLVGTNDASRIWTIMQYSQWTSDELRRQGVQEPVINIVENHRAILQRSYQGHVQLQNSIKGNQGLGNVAQMQDRQLALAQQLRATQAQQSAAAMASQNAPNASQQPMAVRLPGQNGVQDLRQAMTRPTIESLQKAMEKIRQLKAVSQSNLSRAQVHDARFVPEDQRFEYNRLFEQLFKMASELDQQPKLTMFACYMKEDMVKRLVDIIVVTQHQRALLTSSNMPRYLLNLDNVRHYLQICQNVTENLAKRAQSMPLEAFLLNRGGMPQHLQQQANSPPMPPPMSDPTLLQRADRPTPSPRPPSQQAQPLVPQLLPHSNVPTPPNQPSPRTQPIPTTPIPAAAKAIKKSADPAASTPPASASTPANPPTPVHVASSPQTPKSPKAKAPPKPKPRRKPSIKGQPASASTPNPPVSAATPTADQPSPAAATPDSAKRKREDDAPGPSSSGTQSPLKKPKTDWEGPESEELAKKKQAVEAINTEEDATKYFASIEEMLSAVAGEVPAEVQDTLNQLLSNLPDMPNYDSSLDATGMRPSTPPIPPSGGDGLEFFDFTLYTEDERGSKAPTPDLVQTSSTNPSPGSDADSSHSAPAAADTVHIADHRTDEEMDGSDMLRMGFFDEVNGGPQAAYFNPGDFKYDGPMQTLGEAWAFMDR